MEIPGFVTGQPLDGRQVGNAIFQLGPTLPHESPIPMPRALAKVLFPQGFRPWQPAPTAPPPAPAAAPLVPPAGMPAEPAPAPAAPTVDARGNNIQRRQAMPANAKPAAGIRQGFVEDDPRPRTVRIRAQERRGMM